MNKLFSVFFATFLLVGFYVHAAPSNMTSASNFQPYQMVERAMEISPPTTDQITRYSENHKVRQMQQFLDKSVAPLIYRLLRSIEDNTSVNSQTVPAWTPSELPSDLDQAASDLGMRIYVGNLDTTNVSNSTIQQNTSNLVTIKFAANHRVHGLNGVTLRLVPQMSSSLNSALGVVGWYCVTDIEEVPDSSYWRKPQSALSLGGSTGEGSAPTVDGSATYGAYSPRMHGLSWPFFNRCVTLNPAQYNLTRPSTEEIAFGINSSAIATNDTSYNA
jgi:hypothetical protein